MIVTIWERYYRETDTSSERWEFNHVELSEVSAEQTHPAPKGTGPRFVEQARAFATGKWRHHLASRSDDGVITSLRMDSPSAP